VYAGVILHIMKYVEWPAYNGKMTIGVVNSPLLVKALQKAAVGKKVHFKNVSVQKVDNLANLGAVDVLFFSRKVLKGITPETLKSSSKGVLLITEKDKTVGAKVAINFVEKNGNLRFEIYNTALKNQGFKVSDQLKKLAILR
jgi:hypothetical protein